MDKDYTKMMEQLKDGELDEFVVKPDEFMDFYPAFTNSNFESESWARQINLGFLPITMIMTKLHKNSNVSGHYLLTFACILVNKLIFLG